ncbi:MULTISPECIES: GGDEF domain-containing protein [Limnospira]|uniref:Diguanylate cyclase n=1 Tax=Limnospira indica PCC 8005 TaxID=376219 RepID=A0A9P1KL66_9CYAN|nr:GGDEF domain-containing protein [Limnospira indica]CDM98016.1 Diguanylate cyclase [Limnospira indica PCC 8005]
MHLPTLVLTTALNFTANGVFLIAFFKVRNHDFLKWMAYGCFSFALGCLLLFLRFSYGVNVYTLPLSNIFLALMPICLTHSILIFLDKSINRKIHKLYLIIALSVLVFSLIFLISIMHHKWIPGIYTSALNAILYLIPGLIVLREPVRRNTIIRIMLWLDLMLFIVLIARTLILLNFCLSPSTDDTISNFHMMGLLLFLTIPCVNAQTLCFPVLDFMETYRELLVANKKLEQLATVDELTGLLNRRFLNSRLEQEIAYHQQMGFPLSIMLIDIDHFKKINDQFGHLAGDYVLQKVAKLTNKFLRVNDLAFRYGGEEFMVLLPRSEISQALDMAEGLRVSISQLYFNHPDIPSDFQITASFGISELTKDVRCLDDLLKQADLALYQAKSQGRNQVCMG